MQKVVIRTAAAALAAATALATGSVLALSPAVATPANQSVSEGATLLPTDWQRYEEEWSSEGDCNYFGDRNERKYDWSKWECRQEGDSWYLWYWNEDAVPSEEGSAR